MAFRDELEAARQQIGSLEARLREAEVAAQAREAQLQARVRALEAQIAGAVVRPAGAVWLACWLPALVVLGLYVTSIVLAMADLDQAAWGCSQVSIVAGILVTIWSWGLQVRWIPWVLNAAIKAVVILAWGWGWWSPSYRDLPHPSFGTPLYFFWCAPGVILALVIIEGMWLRRGFRPEPADDRTGNR